MKHIFVINPVAGKQDPGKILIPRIREAFAGEPDPEIYITRGRQDAITFVKERCAAAEEELLFYACGGDGTISEVAEGIWGCPHGVLGVIPCGTGNDFVRNFPKLDFTSLPAQRRGSERRIDAIRFNDRLSVNLCNVGMDADVADNMHRFKRLPLVSGSGAYNLAIIYTFFRRLGKKGRFILDGGEPVEVDAVLMVAANGRFYGGNYQGAPLARLDDGLMDVCIVPKLSRLEILRVIGKYQKGLHTSDEHLRRLITYTRCSRLEVEYRQPVTMCVDGETFVNTRITAQVLPRSIRLWVPAEAEAGSPALARAADSAAEPCIEER